MNVFFYGLFMDEHLLATKGVVPTGVRPGFVDGYGLRIGERATLVPAIGSRAYGLVMNIATGQAARLYTEESVAGYVPEHVTAELADGAQVEAACYILPRDKVSGSNRQYAESLLNLATRLGFPDEYLDEIRRAAQP